MLEHQSDLDKRKYVLNAIKWLESSPFRLEVQEVAMVSNILLAWLVKQEEDNPIIFTRFNDLSKYHLLGKQPLNLSSDIIDVIENLDPRLKGIILQSNREESGDYRRCEPISFESFESCLKMGIVKSDQVLFCRDNEIVLETACEGGKETDRYILWRPKATQRDIYLILKLEYVLITVFGEDILNRKIGLHGQIFDMLKIWKMHGDGNNNIETSKQLISQEMESSHNRSDIFHTFFVGPLLLYMFTPAITFVSFERFMELCYKQVPIHWCEKSFLQAHGIRISGESQEGGEHKIIINESIGKPGKAPFMETLPQECTQLLNNHLTYCKDETREAFMTFLDDRAAWDKSGKTIDELPKVTLNVAKELYTWTEHGPHGLYALICHYRFNAIFEKKQSEYLTSKHVLFLKLFEFYSDC